MAGPLRPPKETRFRLQNGEHQNGGITSDVVIIGGGLAGLTCAMGLRGSGLKVTVVEGADVLGGRARSWIDPATGDPIDLGPHIFLTEYPNTLKLLDVFGTRSRIIWQTDQFITIADGQNGILMKMTSLPPPFHFVPSVLADRTVPLSDKFSNIGVTLLAMKMDERDVRQLDSITASEFLLDNGVSQRYIDRFWAFVSMAIMNVPVEECSAAALIGFYRHLIGHNSYWIGFPDSGLSNLFAPQARQVLASSGVNVVTQAAVASFIGGADSVTGIELTDNRRIYARFCVSAIPAHDLLKIVRTEWLERYSIFRDLRGFVPCPYVSTYVWFDRKLTQRQFWARVYSPADLNCDFYDLSNINSGWQDRPSVIASNIIYSHRANGMTDDHIIEATIREICDFIPDARKAKVVHSVVNRTAMAIHCPYPGTERKRPETRTPVRGLLLAGDWTRTGIPASMESAVRSGWLAAEQILADIGRRTSLAISIREPESFGGSLGRVTNWWRRLRSGTRRSQVSCLKPRPARSHPGFSSTAQGLDAACRFRFHEQLI